MSNNRRTYTFVTVYDNLLDHPAWMDLGVEHIGTWVLALGYCRRRKTDGHFPDKATARRWGAGAEVVQELVDAGRFHRPGHTCPDCPQPAEGDLYVHAYLEHQSSREQQEALSAKRAEAGRRGGKARHGQAPDLQGKQGAKQVADAEPSKSEATASKPQPEGEGEREKDTTRGVAAAVAADFEDWWKQYPRERRVGKAAAAKAYTKARQQVDAETLTYGLAGAAAEWSAARTEARFIPHPTTWLNQGRWADEHPVLETTDQPARPVATVMDCGQPDHGGMTGRHEWTDARNRFVCMGVPA